MHVECDSLNSINEKVYLIKNKIDANLIYLELLKRNIAICT